MCEINSNQTKTNKNVIGGNNNISHAPSFSLTYTWSISFGERDMLAEEVDRERRIEVVEKR